MQKILKPFIHMKMIQACDKFLTTAITFTLSNFIVKCSKKYYYYHIYELLDYVPHMWCPQFYYRQMLNKSKAEWQRKKLWKSKKKCLEFK